jgi:deoxyribodipyrimidine photolyase-related protein
MTHDAARKWFHTFLEKRFDMFGKYEDAIVAESPFMFHSGIAMFLNNGLLLPKYVVAETLAYSRRHNVAVQNVEGFLRQIIGWREYCRLYYVTVPPSVYRKHSRTPNPITKMAAKWYKGTTGIPIVDRTIVKAWQYGYLHHIERLMVMANIMTLSRLHPDLVYKWMYEFSMDSWDWVMVFNCYSMGTYSDGGVATWKPYVSSSAYIKRMAREPSGPWEAVWDDLYRSHKLT